MSNNKEILFCPLGGVGEIGANMSLYGYGEKNFHEWIMIDIGVTFTDESIPGIDLIVPDPDFIVQKKKNLKGIILTHGHEDHIGAISYLWPYLKCKIFATPFTATLIKEKFKEKKIDIDEYLKIIPLNGKIDIEPFKIDFVSLTHSILEPNALLISTPSGKIFHTGDWKCDLNPLIGKNMDTGKLKKIGENGILAMVCDSTNIFTEGRSGSESDVRDNLMNLFETIQNRIIVTTFASNVARMESIFKCANKSGRHLSLVGRSMNKIYKVAKSCGYLTDVKPPIDPRDAIRLPRSKIVYLCTGSQGEPKGAMNRIVKDEHPDVEVNEGDTVIFSSRIIPGNEKKLYKMHNLLCKKKINVISEDNAFIHVSGHPGRDEMKDMYQWIKPKISVPVHGEHRHLSEHFNFAKSMQVPHPTLIENGDVLRIFPNEPKIIDKVNNGKLFIDGNKLIDEDNSSLKERRNISHHGYLNINIIISKNGKLERNPIINIKGLPFDELEKNELIYELEDIYFDTCKNKNLNNKKLEKELIDEIKNNFRKKIYNRCNKKPYTNVNLIRI